MTKINEIYKCEICNNIVEILHQGNGELICCGQAMKKMQENAQEASTEKHIPVIKKIENGFEVTIGELEHPMEDDHYIEWIELIAGDKIYRKNLKPGDEPRAKFLIQAQDIKARAYCNLHALWISK